MIPYCWLKKVTYRKPSIPKPASVFSRMWKLKYAEDMTCAIRIRCKLLLMKEFGNFKYDTEVYIKRILKVIIL